MTSPGHGSVSYLCPRCNAALTAQAQDAGQRQPCPQCGKLIKVPGSPSPAAATPTAPRDPGDARPTPVVERGIANMALVCPLCGTRMYATRSQVGKTMVCPDCLETVAVPDATAPGAAQPAARPPRASRSVPPVPTAPPRPAAPRDADEDFKLSDPVQVPAERYLPKQLTDLLRDAEQVTPEQPPGPGSDAQPRTPTPAPQRPRPAAPPDVEPVVHHEFAVKCPTCDTLLYATTDEIGQQLTCPDCMSEVPITAPRPKPRRVDAVDDADYEGQLFTLSEPAHLEVYHRTESGLESRTLGEDALRKAEEEYDRRKQGEPHVPSVPLWDGLFRFLPHAAVAMRLIVSGLLLGTIAKLSMAVYVWAQERGAVWFAALMGSVALTALVAVSFSFIGSTCIVLLQESANGRDDFSDWPETSFMEWVAESLSVAIPAFFAVAPGLVLFAATGALGMPASTRWIFLGLSLYLFFPVVQLSVLEAGALTVPVSPPIIKSLSTDFLLWATFYVMTFAIGLIVALTLSILKPSLSIAIVLLLGVFWALAVFLYYRLLGRLIWACQDRLLPNRDAQREKHDEGGPPAPPQPPGDQA